MTQHSSPNNVLALVFSLYSLAYALLAPLVLPISGSSAYGYLIYPIIFVAPAFIAGTVFTVKVFKRNPRGKRAPAIISACALGLTVVIMLYYIFNYI